MFVKTENDEMLDERMVLFSITKMSTEEFEELEKTVEETGRFPEDFYCKS